MAGPSGGVIRVNSGLAVLDKQNADAPVPTRRHRDIAGPVRAGGGVMTNHPTTSNCDANSLQSASCGTHSAGTR
jgi:hypothetical protein